MIIKYPTERKEFRKAINIARKRDEDSCILDPEFAEDILQKASELTVPADSSKPQNMVGLAEGDLRGLLINGRIVDCYLETRGLLGIKKLKRVTNLAVIEDNGCYFVMDKTTGLPVVVRPFEAERTEKPEESSWSSIIHNGLEDINFKETQLEVLKADPRFARYFGIKEFKTEDDLKLFAEYCLRKTVEMKTGFTEAPTSNERQVRKTYMKKLTDVKNEVANNWLLANGRAPIE